jgi:hypothetical protein
MNRSSLPEHELQILIASQGLLRLIGLLDWELSKYLPFGIDGAQIRYMSVINRDRVGCPEKPGYTMVATSFWNAFTRSLAANLKTYVVDAMKIGLIINLEFPEGCGEREGERFRMPRIVCNGSTMCSDHYVCLAESVDQELLYLYRSLLTAIM